MCLCLSFDLFPVITSFAQINSRVIRSYRMPDPWLELDVLFCQFRLRQEGQSCVIPGTIRRATHKELENIGFLPFCGRFVLVTEL